MSKEMKRRWRNVVQYISASLAQEEDEKSTEMQQQMNDEMYRWLMNNYQLGVKKKKVTIFDKTKTPLP